jgi:hypothetical protein
VNDTNTKLDDVPKAFEALPQKGRNVVCKGKVKANNDLNTHIQGLAPYRTFHLLTHSDFGEKTGRLLVVDRTAGAETLLSELKLPAMSETKPFFFHPGGCQTIGDCLVVPIENGEGESFITFMDVSDPKDIREVNPAARIARPHNDAGSVGVTNLTIAGKDFWLLCAYDNGATDVYLSEDPFPGKFNVIFSLTLAESELQSLSLVTDVANNVFALGLHRTLGGKDMAILYAVDLTKKRMTILSERNFRTSGPDDIIGGGPHFRWGGGIEIVSATELGLFCSGRRYDSGCNINGFRSTPQSLRRAARTRTAVSRKQRARRSRARRPK